MSFSSRNKCDIAHCEDVSQVDGILAKRGEETVCIPASSVGGGSNMVEKVLYEEAGVTFEEYPENSGEYIATVNTPGFVTEAGKTYSIVIDGVAYKAEGYTLEVNGQSAGVFGNASLLNAMHNTQYEDTGEVFFVCAQTHMLQLHVRIPGTTHDVKISVMEEKSSGGMMRVNITVNDDDTYSADKTYAEIAEAITSGIIPYCVFGTFVLSLYHSSVLSEVATFREETKAHKFSVLDTIGTRMGYVSIDINGTVNYEEFIFNPNT